MKFNFFRIAALMVFAFVLGCIAYSQLSKYRNPNTIYVVPVDQTASYLGGEWAVADVSGAAETTFIDKDSAEALVGKLARVNDHEFDFDDMNCPTTFDRYTEHPVKFFYDYGTAPFTMYMHMPNTRIDAGCADVYPLERNAIFIAYQGYFLEAVRRQQDASPEPTTPVIVPPSTAHAK
jgi:hypothetical protein